MRAIVQDSPGRGPPPSAEAVRLCLRRLLNTRVRAYRRELANCRRRLSKRSIHELRIAIRRLLVCLRLVGVAQKEPPGVSASLRAQLRALGDVRDTQVQLQLIKKGAFRSAPEMRPLRDHLRRRKRRRMKAAAQALKSDKALRRLQGWRPRLEKGGPRVVPRLRRLVDGRIRAAIDSLSSIAGSDTPDSEALHRCRVLSRECDYIVEALQPCWRGDPAGELLSSLRARQQGIGRRRDRELLLRRMVRMVREGELQAEPARRFGETLLSEPSKRVKPSFLRDWREVLETLLARSARRRARRFSPLARALNPSTLRRWTTGPSR
jgi:CHAD domain-containing protein